MKLFYLFLLSFLNAYIIAFSFKNTQNAHFILSVERCNGNYGKHIKKNRLYSTSNDHLKLLKYVREVTNASIQLCNKALKECNNDVDKAIEHVRKNTKSSTFVSTNIKVKKEGLVASQIKDDKIVLLELLADSDFVARNKMFVQFVYSLLNVTLNNDLSIENCKNRVDNKYSVDNTNGEDNKNSMDNTNGEDNKNSMDNTNGEDNKNSLDNTNGEDNRNSVDNTNGEDNKNSVDNTNGVDNKNSVDNSKSEDSYKNSGNILSNNNIMDEILSLPYVNEENKSNSTIREQLNYLRNIFREDIKIGRFSKYTKKNSNEFLHYYIHNKLNDNVGLSGVLLVLHIDNLDEILKIKKEDIVNFANDLSMHIISAKPASVSIDTLNPKITKKEMDIIRDGLKDMKKPENILNNMIQGKMKKFYSSIVFLEQEYMLDETKRKVSQVIKDFGKDHNINISVNHFNYFAIGEKNVLME
ncbi:elongation factor Ts [Plasmodium sp. gorilla clade G3]|nr:elongation factor Ts [Plasmodium sp. gorilla clade G3]